MRYNGEKCDGHEKKERERAMSGYMSAHLGTIVVLLIVAFLVVLAIRHILNDRRAGKHSCMGNCGGCPMGGMCEKERKEND